MESKGGTLGLYSSLPIGYKRILYRYYEEEDFVGQGGLIFMLAHCTGLAYAYVCTDREGIVCFKTITITSMFDIRACAWNLCVDLNSIFVMIITTMR